MQIYLSSQSATCFAAVPSSLMPNSLENLSVRSRWASSSNPSIISLSPSLSSFISQYPFFSDGYLAKPFPVFFNILIYDGEQLLNAGSEIRMRKL